MGYVLVVFATLVPSVQDKQVGFARCFHCFALKLPSRGNSFLHSLHVFTLILFESHRTHSTHARSAPRANCARLKSPRGSGTSQLPHTSSLTGSSSESAGSARYTSAGPMSWCKFMCVEQHPDSNFSYPSRAGPLQNLQKTRMCSNSASMYCDLYLIFKETSLFSSFSG